MCTTLCTLPHSPLNGMSAIWMCLGGRGAWGRALRDAPNLLKAVRTYWLMWAIYVATQLAIIVDAMEERAFTEGDVIIRQGDPGDFMHILAAGTCDIFKGAVRVLQCCPGMVFGELALMYDAPRAATVLATSPVLTWAIDRLTFKQVMFGTTQRRVRPP